MPLVVVCGGCKRKLKIPESMVGKTVQCPQCARKFKIAGKAGAKQPVGAGAGKAAPKSPAATAAPKKPAAPPAKAGAAKAPPAKSPPAKAPAAKTPPAKTPPAKGPAAKAPTPPPSKNSTAIKNGGVKKAETPAPPPAKSAAKSVTATPPPPVNRIENLRPKPTAPPRKPGKEEPKKSKKPFILGGIGVVAAFALVWFLFLRPSGAVVSGIVTLDGEPLGGADIQFLEDGKEAGNSFLGRTDESGKYRLEDGNRIPVGKYKVTVKKIVTKDGELAPTPGNEEQPQPKGKLKNAVPMGYSLEETTPLRAEVTQGGFWHEVKLKSDFVAAMPKKTSPSEENP